MDYEKKYKETLKRANTLYENANGMILKKWVEHIFPELKESEDERIRKALINIFATHKDYEVYFGVSVEDIRVWLEKQSEKNPIETTWKPSEEQMKSLRWVIEYGNTTQTETLKGMYEQLKELKG